MFTRVICLTCALVAGQATALGAFSTISSPTPAYTSGTTVLSLAPFDSDSVTSIFDLGLTIDFTTTGFVTSAPAVWAAWSVAPESENPGGPVPLAAFSVLGSFVLSFSAPVSTFGVEIEPDTLDVGIPVTATFFNGATQVGQITRTLTNTSGPGGISGGARLFAGTSLDQPFTSLVISYDTNAGGPEMGMALAYFRYTLAQQQTGSVPEPATAWAVLTGLAALAAVRIRRS